MMYFLKSDSFIKQKVILSEKYVMYGIIYTVSGNTPVWCFYILVSLWAYFSQALNIAVAYFSFIWYEFDWSCEYYFFNFIPCH